MKNKETKNRYDLNSPACPHKKYLTSFEVKKCEFVGETHEEENYTPEIC